MIETKTIDGIFEYLETIIFFKSFLTIKEEDVCIEQHGAGKSQLHLPPSAELRQQLCPPVLVKTDLLERLDDVRLVTVLEERVVEDKTNRLKEG